MKSKSKGFTLIELLVVVAIISLLSSVILAVVKDARSKAKLSSIKEMSLSLRTEAELYSHDNSGKYVDFGVGNSNNTYSGLYTNSASTNVGFFKEDKIMEIMNKIITTTNSNAYYYIRENSWAVVFNTTSVAFENNLIDKAYAAPPAGPSFAGTSYVCIDSFGNNIFKEDFSFNYTTTQLANPNSILGTSVDVNLNVIVKCN